MNFYYQIDIWFIEFIIKLFSGFRIIKTTVIRNLFIHRFNKLQMYN